MGTTKWSTIWFAAALGLLVISHQSAHSAAILEVGPSGYTYSAIQDAINDAAAGDTVLVHDGTYVENINFNGKPITVRSENGPFYTAIDGGGSGRVVTYDAAPGSLGNASIEGFTIINGNAEFGAGIRISSSAADRGLSCIRCIIKNNFAGGNGGGIHITGFVSSFVSNCIITDNEATNGAGVYISGMANVTINHSTVSENRAEGYGGGLLGGDLDGLNSPSIRIENCILWGDTAGAGANEIYTNFAEGGSLFIGNSDIEGGYTEPGNIDADPLFLDAEWGGFHLSQGSPCINTGTDTALYPPAVDFEGDPRPNDGSEMPDMGADEYVPKPDLFIESLRVSPTFPEPDEPFNVMVTITNQGPSDIAGLFRCAFNSGEKPVSSWEFWDENDVLAGESVTRTFDFRDGRATDSYVFWGNADWDNDIGELSELNNHDMVLLVIGWCAGDYNGDGDVDGMDLSEFMRRYAEDDLSADLNNNGQVEDVDVGIFADYLGRTDCATPHYGSIIMPTGLAVLQETDDDLEISLSDPAPADGVLVTVTSDNPAILSIALPGTVYIPAGETSGAVTVTGVALGIVTVRASAVGYTPGVGSVQVVSGLITVPQTLDIPLETEISIPITIAPDPAPAGGLVIDLSSSDASRVEIVTPTVTIPEGQYSANGRIRGVGPGVATITVGHADYLSDSCQATTVVNLNIIQSSVLLNPSFPAEITIQLESAGSPTAAPAPGISVGLTSDNPGCATVTSPVQIPTGQVITTATLTYGGSANLPCTTSVTAGASNIDPDTINVTVNPTPGITVSTPTRVGSGLQYRGDFTLGAGNHGGVTVTLTSSDPSRALLSTDAVTAGATAIDVVMPDGQTESPYFYVQGLEGVTGTVTITATAPGFTDGSDTTEIVQPALTIRALATDTTTLSDDDPFYVRVGVPYSDNSSVQQSQDARAGGGGLIATVQNSNAAVGQLVGDSGPGQSVTVSIAEGQCDSPNSVAAGGVAFDPLTGGTTEVAAAIPGFIATTAATVAVIITAPGITVSTPTRVGSGLQYRGDFTLGAGNHGGVTVTLTSSDPSRALLSTDAVTAGVTAIDVVMPDGQTESPYFYVQGLEGVTGTVTTTATAPGFTDGSDTTEVVQPALTIRALATNTTTLSDDDPFYVRVGIPYSDNSSVQQSQDARAGGGGLIATVQNSNAAVGQLVSDSGPGQSVMVSIAEGQCDSPGSVAAGGVAFDPLTGGTTEVAASIPGFIATTAATVAVIITAPGITVSTPTRVGSGLQYRGDFTLGAGNHGGVTVTLTSSDPSRALLSTDAVTAGATAIDVVMPDGQTESPYFYVQGLEGVTGTVTITATAPGFTDGSDTTEIVQPALTIRALATDTTTLSDDDPFYVRVGVPYSDNSSVQQSQDARAGGGGLIATVQNSNAAVGQLVGDSGPGQSVTVSIAEGQCDSPNSVAAGGVAFDPLTGGTTEVAAAIPGFIATTAATVAVIITAPGITVSTPTRVGSGLQYRGDFTLGAGNHGGVTVTLTSSDPSRALLSTDAVTAGATAIDVVMPDGQTDSPYFYVQGLEGVTGTVTITATAPGFTDGSDTTEIVQPALTIRALATDTTTLSDDDPFYVRVGVPYSDNSSVQQSQDARAGGGGLIATVQNSNAAVGQLVSDSGPGQSVMVLIAEGQCDSPNSVAAGGVAFDPLTGGTTEVAAAIPGFIATDAALVTVTVTSE